MQLCGTICPLTAVDCKTHETEQIINVVSYDCRFNKSGFWTVCWTKTKKNNLVERHYFLRGQTTESAPPVFLSLAIMEGKQFHFQTCLNSISYTDVLQLFSWACNVQQHWERKYKTRKLIIDMFAN